MHHNTTILQSAASYHYYIHHNISTIVKLGRRANLSLNLIWNAAERTLMPLRLNQRGTILQIVKHEISYIQRRIRVKYAKEGKYASSEGVPGELRTNLRQFNLISYFKKIFQHLIVSLRTNINGYIYI